MLDGYTIRPVWTDDQGSMAQDTARSRWPKTVENMVDDMKVSLRATGEDKDKEEEGIELIKRLKEMKNEIERDSELRLSLFFFLGDTFLPTHSLSILFVISSNPQVD